MPTYVRVRDPGALTDRLNECGLLRSTVAERAEIHLSRLSQLANGAKTAIAWKQAAAIEDTLEVPRGSLFIVDIQGERDLLAPYLVPEPVSAA